MAQPTEAPPIPEDREPAAGPFPYQIAPPAEVRRRRITLFVALGLAVYLITLLATLPARYLVQRADEPGIWLAVSGTVWNGEAALAHGHAVRWTWRPLASLASLSFATDLRVTGPDTAVEGMAQWRWSGMVLDDLEGHASASLLSALAPSLPFVCDFPMRMSIDRIAFGGQKPGASGRIRTSPGSCTSRAGLVTAASPVPALTAEAASNVGGSAGWVAPQGNRSNKLITFAVTPNGETAVTVDPAASAVIPGAEAIRSLAR